jgi:hypothetical protein
MATQSAPAQRTLVHTDITPNTNPELASRFLDVPNMPWQPTKFPGIEIKVLRRRRGPHHGAVQAGAGRRGSAA